MDRKLPTQPPWHLRQPRQKLLPRLLRRNPESPSANPPPRDHHHERDRVSVPNHESDLRHESDLDPRSVPSLASARDLRSALHRGNAPSRESVQSRAEDRLHESAPRIEKDQSPERESGHPLESALL